MKKVKKLLFSAIITLALAIVCLNFFPASAISAQAAKVRINKRSAVLLKGQKEKLKIKGTKEEVEWKSKNKSVAKVSKKGVVTARKKGKTTIIARVGKKTYKCKVAVEQPYIKVQGGSEAGLGETRQLFMCGTSYKKFTWKSSDPRIASVDKNGVVTGKSNGNVRIYTNINGFDISKYFRVYLSVEKDVTISTILLGNRGAARIEVTNNGTEALKFERRGRVSGKYNYDSTHYSGSDKTDEEYVIVNPGETKSLRYYNDGYANYFFDVSYSFYFYS